MYISTVEKEVRQRLGDVFCTAVKSSKNEKRLFWNIVIETLFLILNPDRVCKKNNKTKQNKKRDAGFLGKVNIILFWTFLPSWSVR